MALFLHVFVASSAKNSAASWLQRGRFLPSNRIPHRFRAPRGMVGGGYTTLLEPASRSCRGVVGRSAVIALCHGLVGMRDLIGDTGHKALMPGVIA